MKSFDDKAYKPFATIEENITGLSQHQLREGCKSGMIPHVKSGIKYLIYIPALLEQLEAKAKSNVGR